MKKSTQDELALISPPLPPSFRMIDEMVELLPRIENQQKATIKYFKAEAKAMKQFVDAMDSMKIIVPWPKPPLIPLMPKYIKAIPNVAKFEKELSRYYAGAARRMEQFEKDLKAMPGR
jgi:hypothetical protein